MLKFKTWISAARPRTLPLSISGILVGAGMAARDGIFDTQILIFALLTTLGLQILSNFANDYGDGVKGTDNEDRVGPMRALQSGIISDKEMKTGMIVTGIITFIFAGILIFSAFEKEELFQVILFFVLGLASIIAAIKYTVGKTAYGYRGLGDLFVFLFFGLLSAVGTYFLYTKALHTAIWVMGSVIGLLSTAVLNLNNMRDRESDLKANKITLAVKLGEIQSKKYHFGLILIALCLSLIYILKNPHYLNWLMLIAFIPLLIHLKVVKENEVSKNLDPELKKVALSTVLFAAIYFFTGFFY